jgi:hypothetical protein
MLAEIKADPNLQGIPVAVLTSSTESGDVAEAYGLGHLLYHPAGAVRRVRGRRA